MELLTFIALVVYGGGAFKFWQGFKRTHYSDGKVYLSLLWPLFFVANKTYRQNFSRALKG
jgi:hypothetical protein